MPEQHRRARKDTTAMGRRRGSVGVAALLLTAAILVAAVALLWPGYDRSAFAEWLLGSGNELSENSDSLSDSSDPSDQRLTTITTHLDLVDQRPETIPGWQEGNGDGENRDEGTSADGRETGGENTEQPSQPAASSLPETGSRTGESIAPSAPTRIVIPAINVNSTVVPVGLLPDGAMEVPDFGLAGWYEPGPMPGEPGPAVVAAHVDSRAGPDVFYRLRELQVGDEIRMVGSDGIVFVFAVQKREQVPKSELPTDRIWNQTDEPVIRLITCGGDFDYSTRHYRDNIIVYGTFLRTGT